MNSPRSTTHPYFFAALSGFISSLGAVFCRGALHEIPALWVATIQFAFAIPILLLFCKPGFFVRVWSSPLRNTLLIVGVLQGLGSIFYTYGSSFTTATNALFLTKVLPYWVLFWEWCLYRKAISRNEYILLAVHVAGAWFLSSGGEILAPSFSQLGDLFLILAMMAAALATVLSQKLVQTLPTREVTLSYMSTAALFVLTITLLTSQSLPVINSHETEYAYLFLNSVCFIGLHLFALLALVNGKPWKVTALRALGPLLGLPFAHFLLGEKVTVAVLIGGLTVLLTSMIMILERRSAPRALSIDQGKQC